MVGAQKVVPDLATAFDPIERHSLPLESERMREIHEMSTYVEKHLVINHEHRGRISVLLLEETVGF